MQNKKSKKIIVFTVIAAILLSALVVGAVFLNRRPAPSAPDDLFSALPASGQAVSVPDDYTLEQMLIVSRHNIRSPLSGGDSLLSQITPHEWFDWTSESGELSVKGGQLESAMGQYFRKYLASIGFLPENWIPQEGEVRFYANALQRTIATAEFFAAGMLPVGNVPIEYHGEYGEVDPFFCPVIRNNTPEFEAQVRAEIDALCGEGGLTGVGESLRDSYALLETFLDFKDSRYAAENGVDSIPTDDTAIELKTGAEIKLTGGLKTGCSAVDALKLQIYEEEDLQKALFGHELSAEQLQTINAIGDIYQEICEGSRTLATQVMAPIIAEIEKEFETPQRKFTFFCGHDSTITSLVSALDVSDYLLPGSISQKAPIGVKLVFEKYLSRDGQEYMKLKMCYAGTDQLRRSTVFSLENAPLFYELELDGLQKNADGYYKYEDVTARFEEAIALGRQYCEDAAFEDAA